MTENRFTREPIKKESGGGGSGEGWKGKQNRFGGNMLNYNHLSQMLLKIFFLLWKYCDIVERTLD